MAYIGKCDCPLCGREVDVSENRSGYLYFRCAPCGLKAQNTSQRGNRMLLEKVRREEAEEPAANPDTPAPREPATVPTPNPAPAKPAVAVKPRAKSGFFFSGGA